MGHIFLALGCLVATAYRPAKSQAADSSGIFKTSIRISTTVRHWAIIVNHRDEDAWSWAPRIKFNVLGPITSGSQFSVEFFMPSGRPWVKYDCRTPEVEAGKIGNLEGGYGIPYNELRAIREIGTFTFKIQMRNELAGTSTTAFSGRFNVKKFHVGPDLPKTKENFEYYVDHDWQLPIGYCWYPRPYRSADGVDYYDDYAPLFAAFWFKGATTTERDLAAYLFHDGKEISNTKLHGHSVNDSVINTSVVNSPYEYLLARFEFTNVFAFAQDKGAHPGYYLDQNPGQYEVKVLRQGQLARVLRFSVGTDGKIADNGIANANGILGPRLIFPAQVMGDTDGTWESAAWKTEALYGNPLQGLSLP
jgi:hypothetical protein